MSLENILVEIAKMEILRREKPPKEGDYENGGLLHCGTCHKPKQKRITICEKEMIVHCMCDCEQREYQEEQEHRRKEQEIQRIKILRAEGVQDRSLKDVRFETAKTTKQIEHCKRYASKWGMIQAENIGLLMYGPPGGGKTFAAACIANHLIDQGVPVMMTSLPKILNAGWDKKEEILAQLQRYPLLVLDDLGVERQSQYALETVYSVIDERYKARKPIIVTTNLSINEIRNPKDIEAARIYSRIVEMCVPMSFDGESTRAQEGARKMQIARELFQ